MNGSHLNLSRPSAARFRARLNRCDDAELERLHAAALYVWGDRVKAHSEGFGGLRLPDPNNSAS